MDKQYIGVDEVSEMVGLGIRTIWRFSASNRFPKPIKIGRRSLWSVNVITTFLQDKEIDNGQYLQKEKV